MNNCFNIQFFRTDNLQSIDCVAFSCIMRKTGSFGKSYYNCALNIKTCAFRVHRHKSGHWLLRAHLWLSVPFHSFKKQQEKPAKCSSASAICCKWQSQTENKGENLKVKG